MASVSVNVTGISAKATLPAPIEENGGAFTENTFAESPLSSENSNPTAYPFPRKVPYL